MRAGKLTKTITLQRATTSVDANGTPVQTWADLASVRAELVQSTAQEFMRGWGTSTEAATIFRIRFLEGLSPADRVTYASVAYDLKEIKELGRREGLELRCVARGPA